VRRAAFVAALTAAAAGPVPAQTTLPTIRLGLVGAIESSLEPYFAAELGFFQKAGISVEIQSFASGNAAAAAIVGGTLDAAITTPLTLASAAIRGLPFTVLAAGNLNTPKAPTIVAVVSKNSPLREPKDLIGKTVGLNTLRTISEVALDAWLERSGVDIAKVKAVEIPFSALLPALARGQIDCAFPGEPAVSGGLRAGEIRILGDPMAAIGRRYLSGLWFTSRPFVQRNPEATKRFAEVIYQTARWANAHTAESAPIVAKYTKLPLEDIRGMVRADFAEQLRFSELQPPIDAGFKYGILSRAVRAQELVS
jgi:NitT/TauT family transport system substrate-binding protein